MYSRLQSHTLLRIVSTTTLYRPVGPEELALIEASGWNALPPRLPEQPIAFASLWLVCHLPGPMRSEAYRTRFEVTRVLHADLARNNW
jgi:hypothetical protein